MEKKFINFFKSFKKTIRNNYNLADFAKKSKNQTLPRTRASINKEYDILLQYKQNKVTRANSIKKLMDLKDIDLEQATLILDNVQNNIIPMKLKWEKTLSDLILLNII